jgi:hypothetical protein
MFEHLFICQTSNPKMLVELVFQIWIIEHRYRGLIPFPTYVTFYFFELTVNLSYLCKQCKQQKRQLSVLLKSFKITMQM